MIGIHLERMNFLKIKSNRKTILMKIISKKEEQKIIILNLKAQSMLFL